MEKHILLADTPAEKAAGWLKRVTSVNVLKGELLVPLSGEPVARSDGKPHNYRLVKDDTVTLRAEEEHIAPLTDRDFLLLIAIESSLARYKVFVSNKLEWGGDLRIGQAVYVSVLGQAAATNLRVSAVVRFIGEVASFPGLMFGLEIMDPNYRGYGTTDGTFGAKRYFACNDNDGLLVALDRISLDAPRNAITDPPKGVQDEGKIPPHEDYSLLTDKDLRSVDNHSKFAIGDRVVAYTKRDVPVHGTVKWAGIVYGDSRAFRGFVVGIEMDVSVKKDDFEGALSQKSIGHKLPEFRHSKVFLPEAVVLREEDFKQDQIPTSSLSPRTRAEIAKECGYKSAAEMVADQKKQIKQVAAEEKVKALLEIQKVVPHPLDEQYVQEQEKALRTLERQNEERKKAVARNPVPNRALQEDRSNGRASNRHHSPYLGTQTSQPPSVEHQHHQNRPAAQTAYERQQSHTYESIQQLHVGQVDAVPSGDPRGMQGYDPSQLHQHPSQHVTPQPMPRVQPTPPSHHPHHEPRLVPAPPSNAPPQMGQIGAQAFPSLEIGSIVQVSNPPRYGVIRWAGLLQGIQGLIAGVELEDYMEGCEDGTWKGERYFTCAPGRGFFCPYSTLIPDQRFTEGITATNLAPKKNPLDDVPYEELTDQYISDTQIVKYMGEKRGIQGHQNSCYLDATVFGLFALSDVFDPMFLDEVKDPAGAIVKDMLWKGIVNPLRKNGVVRHESVMALRNKLEELGKMKGVNQDEKDPEEFLNMLFKHTLEVEPFISIKRPFGTEQEYFVQLFLEPDESLKLPPTVGQLLNKMFIEQKIMFTRVPSKLLIQIPRFGRQFKTYEKVIPALHLDVMGLIDSPAHCNICEKPAWNKCSECTQHFLKNKDFVYYCDSCCKLVHGHSERAKHTTMRCDKELDSVGVVSELDLLSVICIETSHYVCFTRSASQDRWIFFDSMANRVYDKYNIPMGVDCTQELKKWVYCENLYQLQMTPSRELPEYVRRFTQDIYLCIYIQPDVGMYG